MEFLGNTFEYLSCQLQTVVNSAKQSVGGWWDPLGEQNSLTNQLKCNISIYILALEEGRYYIGKTKKSIPEERILDHFRGKGSVWTRAFAPVKIVKIYQHYDEFDEDKYTKLYMSMYGIDNVRGGSYVTMALDPYTKRLLQKELWCASDVCVNCGSDQHWVSQCFERETGPKRIDLRYLPEDEPVLCSRCGRNSHPTLHCYASKHLNGTSLN